MGRAFPFLFILLILFAAQDCYSEGIIEWVFGDKDDVDVEVIEVKREDPFKGDPIPSGPEMMTTFEYRERFIAWRRALYKRCYNTVGSRNPKWDKQALHLLHEIPWFYWNTSQFRGIGEKMLKVSTELMEMGCDDPFIVNCHATLLNNLHSSGLAEPFVRRSLELLEKSNYPKRFWYYAARSWGLICLRQGGRDREYQECRTKRVRYMAEAMKDEMFEGDARQYYIDGLKLLWSREEFLHIQHKDQFVIHMGALKDVDPWIEAMVMGYFHASYAEASVQRHFGKKLPKADHEQHNRHLQEAAEYYMKAHELCPQYPHAAARMVHIRHQLRHHVSGKVRFDPKIMALNERVWFDRAVKANMDFGEAYSQYVWALRCHSPSWEPLYAFALECLNTDRFDTDAVNSFMSATSRASQYFKDRYEFYRRPGVYENMRKMCEGILNAPRRRPNHEYYRTLLPVMAWACGRHEESAKLFKELGDGGHPETLNYFPADPRAIRGEVAVRTGPLRDTADRAEALWKKGRDQRSLPMFESILAETRSNPYASYFLRERINVLRLEKALKGRTWHNFMPDKDLAGWQILKGKWVVDDKGHLAGISDDQGLKMLFNANIAGNFEVKGMIGDIEQRKPEFDAGLLLGYSWNSYDRDMFTALRFRGNDNKVSVGRGFWKWKKEADVLLQEVNTFRIQIWNKTYTVYVNGALVLDSVPVGKKWWTYTDTSRIGIMGGYYDFTPLGQEVRFYELQIRGIDKKPAPEKSRKEDPKEIF